MWPVQYAARHVDQEGTCPHEDPVARADMDARPGQGLLSFFIGLRLFHFGFERDVELAFPQQLPFAKKLKAILALLWKLTPLKPEMQVDNAERIWKLDGPLSPEQFLFRRRVNAADFG